MKSWGNNTLQVGGNQDKIWDQVSNLEWTKKAKEQFAGVIIAEKNVI